LRVKRNSARPKYLFNMISDAYTAEISGFDLLKHHCELLGGHMTAQGPKGRSYGGATKRISPRTRCESYGRVPPVDSSGGASDRPPLDEWGGLRSGFSLEAPHPTYYKTCYLMMPSPCAWAPQHSKCPWPPSVMHGEKHRTVTVAFVGYQSEMLCDGVSSHRIGCPLWLRSL
jgi:hypothetical protein